jgi:hypothetical protein
MATAAVLGLLLAAGPGDEERARRLAEAVKFAVAPPSSPEGERVLALLSDRGRWAAGFRTVETRLGVAFAEDTKVEVTWDYDGDEFVKMSGKTTLRFHLGKLEAYQAKLDELDRRRKELAKEGKKLVYRLPPAKMELFIPHELVHVLQKQKGAEAPEWFEEGLAQWVAEDPNLLVGFALTGRPVIPVDGPPAEPNDVYARGHLFFLWLQSRGALKGAVRAFLADGVPWRKALEDAAALPWAALSEAEQKAGTKEITKYRPPAK